MGLNPFGDDGWFTGRHGLIGSITGANAAASAQRDATDRALELMDRQWQEGREDLRPLRERDLAARDRYSSELDGMRPANLEPYFQQKWQDQLGQANAAFGKAGNYGGGAWQRSLARGSASLQAERERAFDEFQWKKIAARAGLFSPQAAGQMAQGAWQQGQQGAGMLQQQGMNDANSAMAGFNTLAQLGGLAIQGYGAYGMNRRPGG